jgi:hypothetical protein
MKIMVAIDMELLLSEYPEFEEDEGGQSGGS